MNEAGKKNSGVRALRVGLIGCGWVSQHHLDAWKTLSGRAEVVALADPDIESARRRGQEFDISACYASAEAMFAAEALDAVDIASPRETHVALVEMAASRGLPVLCQKPLAPTLEEAVRLVETIGADARVMVHENWRFRPYIRSIREQLRNGAIGELQQCQVELFSSGLVRPPRGPSPAVERQPFFGVVPRLLVMEILIHHIDALRYLFGELKLLGSWLGRFSGEVRGEDNAAALFETTPSRADERSAAIVLQSSLTAAGLPPRTPDRIRIFGTKGTLELANGTLLRKGGDQDAITFDLEQNYRASYEGAIAHFVDCIETRRDFETSLADNLKTLKLAEDIYQRSRYGNGEP